MTTDTDRPQAIPAGIVADAAERVRADPAFGDALASLAADRYPGAADLADAVTALLDADRDGTDTEGDDR